MRHTARVGLFAANVLLITLGTSVPVLALLAFVLDAFCIFRFGKQDGFALLLFLMPFAAIFKLFDGMPSFFQFLVLATAIILAVRKGSFSARPIILLCLFSLLIL